MGEVMERKDNFEWLGSEMRAKSMTYEVSVRATGERPPNWEEKAGVFAVIEDDWQKDLAWVIASGDYTDNRPEYKRVLKHLTECILSVANTEKKYKKDLLPVICRKIAQMEFFFFLYSFLREDYTLQGQLRIVDLLDFIQPASYEKSWQHYGEAIKMMLDEAKTDVDVLIGEYRQKIYNEV